MAHATVPKYRELIKPLHRGENPYYPNRQTIYLVNGQKCDAQCDSIEEKLVCGFDPAGVKYKMFPSKCALTAYMQCYKVVYIETPLEYCVKDHNIGIQSRRSYGESCPVFCPSHYRPVCGASKYRDYAYRTFNNGCYLDMINCRGNDDFDGYTEVPLEYCQRHAMKNIFKEQIVFSGMPMTRDYD